MDNRLAELTNWLTNSLSLNIESIQAASEDASFRRYFRIIEHANENKFDCSVIAMDAPPAQESLNEFIAIDQMLVANDIHAPEIYAIDLEKGFMLLEDLGNRTYLDELHDNPDQLYTDAITSLLAIQNIKPSNTNSYESPLYNKQLIEQELNLFTSWYCQRHLGVSLSKQELSIWEGLKSNLVEVFQQQPQVWVHRDYHSRNLMITNNNSPGVIDFQDMVWGPISYDLASLFKDCYIEWPRSTQLKWLQSYLDKLHTSKSEVDFSYEQLVKWFDLTGLQRHLKVLGIFCRLNYRDNKSHYLLDLPLVEKYINEVLTIYPEFEEFSCFFNSLTKNDQ